MGLSAMGIEAAMLTSQIGKEEETKIYKALEHGGQELRFVYVTPEKVRNSLSTFSDTSFVFSEGLRAGTLEKYRGC